MIERFEQKLLIADTGSRQLTQWLQARLGCPVHVEHPSAMLYSSYYDTPDYDYYWSSVEGDRHRIKLRRRSYEWPRLPGKEHAPHPLPAHFEVKRKDDRWLTKEHLPDAEARQYIVSYQLRETLLMRFLRDYLWVPALGLRVTLDHGLTHTRAGQPFRPGPGSSFAIVELKYAPDHPMLKKLPPLNRLFKFVCFSKYVHGLDQSSQRISRYRVA